MISNASNAADAGTSANPNNDNSSSEQGITPEGDKSKVSKY